MKSKFIELGECDLKAQEHFRASLSVCAEAHLLSRKLLARFSTAGGPMFAIIGEWFDLDEMINYDYTVFAPAGSGPVETGFYTHDRLVRFVVDYLRISADAVVVCENWLSIRKDIPKWVWAPSRTACFGDNEVFHIVTPDDSDLDNIEKAVVARHHYQTNVCSSTADVPNDEIPNEVFLDEIVENTKHIFIPAFDGSGYLIWTPKLASWS